MDRPKLPLFQNKLNREFVVSLAFKMDIKNYRPGAEAHHPTGRRRRPGLRRLAGPAGGGGMTGVVAAGVRTEALAF